MEDEPEPDGEPRTWMTEAEFDDWLSRSNEQITTAIGDHVDDEDGLRRIKEREA